MIGYRKDQPLGHGQCPSIHMWSDARCIRRAGHDGLCRSRLYVRRDIGTLSHTTWSSKGGVFVMHNGYHTRYPSNMAAARTAATEEKEL